MFGVQVLRQGGVLIIPLLLMSVAVVSIGVERLRFWRQWGRDGDSRLQDLVNAFQGKSQVQACLYQDLLQARLKQRLSRWDGCLELAMALGPLMGLLATVLGLMDVLASLGSDLVMPAGTRPLLSSYGQVLIGSALGLLVAFEALLVQRLCRLRRDAVLARFEQSCLQCRSELA
ncbi:MAG: MotA/TolQ/ExbB proton channel family protein [Synechococcus sp.]|nr:MotA/TolQ/ExbB proton channel family protein [Synechococcus sp.]